MMNATVQESITTISTYQTTITKQGNNSPYRFISSHLSKQVILLVFTALLLCSSLIVSHNQPTAHAANPGPGNACSWYTVHWGDTLTNIARSHNTTVWTLAQVNYIRNINLIFVAQQLCIPYRVGGSSSSGGTAGVLSNGTVRWYAYNALDWSNRSQVNYLLHQAAARYGLPANLLMAIAWQESGWYQHVIAWDGGIGVMQLMPYTAKDINDSTGIRRDPYRLVDNINLGATYLSWLYHNFHGNLYQTISGYNEGGWAVIHRGIFNWRYVNNVLALMRQFR
jgi:LysM repeat protein